MQPLLRQQTNEDLRIDAIGLKRHSQRYEADIMRILIVSDIHSNQVAFETVLATVEENGSVDTLWCIGDTIGYGPRPNECVAIIRSRAEYVISGNHDLACIGEVDLQDFNPDARLANEWNGRQLSDSHLSWMRELQPKLTQLAKHPSFSLAHGSPRQPVWEYLLTVGQAQDNFGHSNFPNQICFVGHSHIPLFFQDDFLSDMEVVSPQDGHVLTLNPEIRYIINPGSVGQPRNRDPRASYAILDTETQTVSFHRVSYNVYQTQEQMRDAGLPIPLVRRLQFGI